MGEWLPVVDSTVGGIADNVEGAGQWVGGGIADVVTGTVGTATETAGDAAGNVAGGLFGGLGNWMLKLAALAGGVAVAVMYIS